jgi:uncharacterized membrane protein (UPF0136 family)
MIGIKKLTLLTKLSGQLGYFSKKSLRCLFYGASTYNFFTDNPLAAVIMARSAVINLVTVRNVAGLAFQLSKMAIMRIPVKEICGICHMLITDMALQAHIIIIFNRE